MKKVISILFFYVILVISCEEEQFLTKIVVQSYLIPNSSIVVKLNQVNTYNLTDEIPAENAIVRIIYNNEAFILDEDINEPGRYVYNGDNLKIIEGALYFLEIDYMGAIIKSETIVPPKPANISTNYSEIEVSSNLVLGLVLSWDKFTDYTIISINYLDEIDSSNEIQEALNTEYKPYYLNSPYSLNFLSVSYFDFKYYGNYSIKITSINEEYKKLYDFRENYRFETQPLETNIQNGLGIFTGVSSDSIVIKIKKP